MGKKEKKEESYILEYEILVLIHKHLTARKFYLHSETLHLDANVGRMESGEWREGLLPHASCIIDKSRGQKGQGVEWKSQRMQITLLRCQLRKLTWPSFPFFIFFLHFFFKSSLIDFEIEAKSVKFLPFVGLFF